jgi:tetratricopeptide (TPR) repeat protein
MRLYTRQGRRAAALRQYQVCVATLRKELGVEPEPETRALYREILPQAGRAVRPGVDGPVGSRPRLRPHDDAEAPLVGRDSEAKDLRGALATAWSGDARTVFIVGEAGIGKSRLAEALAEDAIAQGGRALLARAWESEQLPFQLWIDAARDGNVLSDRELLESLPPGGRTELGRLFPELGEAVSPRSAGRQGAAALFEAVRELLDRLGERQPLVLVLDDVHWADEMSLRLLFFLARRLRGVLLVATVREEQLGDAAGLARLVGELEREGRARSLHLSGLSRRDTGALVRALARAGTGADWLAHAGDRIWTLSEGNPFVIVECMRTLPGGGGEDVALPARVRDLITSRLDRLSEPGRQLAAAAAVIGREFGFGVAQAAAGLTGEEAAEAAEELVRRRVLDAAGEQFRITHDRIRQVIYERLLSPRRRLLHERVAEALEAAHAARPDDAADQLAAHYAQAGVADRALPWLSVLVKTALQRYAFAEADRWLDQALGLIDRVSASERDRFYLPLVVRRKAYLLSLRGCSREVLDLLQPLHERVEAAGDPGLAGWYFFRLAYAYNYVGDPDATRSTATRALDEARRSGDLELMACTHCALAMSHYCIGEPWAGAEHARQAIALLGASPSVWLGYAHAYLAGNLYLLGELRSALGAAETAAAIGVQLGETAVQVEAGLSAGRIRVACGDWARVREDCRVALESQSDLSRAAGTALIGYACLDQGSASEALPLLRDSVDQLTRLGLRYLAGRFMPLLAEAHLATGDLGAARRHAQEACDLNRQTRSRWALGFGQRALGRVAWAEGALPEAERQLREALATFAAVPMPYELARTHQMLAELASVTGQRHEALAGLREARSLLQRLSLPKRLAELERISHTLGVTPDL